MRRRIGNTRSEDSNFVSISLLLIVVIFFLPCTVSGRYLDSDELLVGEWKTLLRCSPLFYESELFPLKKLKVAIHDTSNDRKVHNVLTHGFWQPSKNFPCRLSIYQNGTFHLEPETYTNKVFDNSDYLSVHGKWKVQSNPYCATDRFYDQLIFDSYPRLQKQILENSNNSKRSHCVKKVKLQIRCRLHGHFTAGRLRFSKAFAKGRMSHGYMIMNRRNDEQIKNTGERNTSMVAASFVATRLIPSKAALTSRLDDHDKLVFGY